MPSGDCLDYYWTGRMSREQEEEVSSVFLQDPPKTLLFPEVDECVQRRQHNLPFRMSPGPTGNLIREARIV